MVNNCAYFNIFILDIHSNGVVVRMSILDTKVDGSILSINMFSP